MAARQSAASCRHTLHNRLHTRASAQVTPCHHPAVGPDPAGLAPPPELAKAAAFVNEKDRRCQPMTTAASKAGDQDRTGDIQLGKLTFYR